MNTFQLTVQKSDRSKESITLTVIVSHNVDSYIVILRNKTRVLGSGASIKNPEDKYDDYLAIRIALKRAASAAYQTLFTGKKHSKYIDHYYRMFYVYDRDRKAFIHAVDGSFRKYYKNNLLSKDNG